MQIIRLNASSLLMVFSYGFMVMSQCEVNERHKNAHHLKMRKMRRERITDKKRKAALFRNSVGSVQSNPRLLSGYLHP